MAVETREMVPIVCSACGGHLCDRSGSHFLILGDSRQKVLVPDIDYIKCQRLLKTPDGEKTRCNTIWKP